MRMSEWSSDVCSSDLKYLALECGQRWLAVRVDGGCARTPLIQCDDIGDLAQGHEQLEPRPLGRADAGTTRATREIYDGRAGVRVGGWERSEEHTSELQSLMRISYAVFCLKQKNTH